MSSDRFEENDARLDLMDRPDDHDIPIEEQHFDRYSTELESPTESTPYQATLSIAFYLLIALLAGVLGVWAAQRYHNIAFFSTGTSRLSDFRKIPPQWFGYREKSVFFIDLVEPGCFDCSKKGILAIADDRPPSVHLYSIDSQEQGRFPLKSPARCLVFGKEGTDFSEKLLVASHESFDLYDLDGSTVSSWPLPTKKSAIWSLALTEDGFFAADSGEKLVYRYDMQGNLLNQFGERQTEAQAEPDAPPIDNVFAGFVIYRAPMTLAYSDKNGLLYVTNPGKHRVEAFTVDGIWEPSLSWGGGSAGIVGFVGCCNPVALSVLADGRIITAEKSIPRVKVFQSDGKLDWVVVGPDQIEAVLNKDGQPVRSTVTSNDLILGIDSLEEDVIVFDPSKKVVRIFSPR